jgi:hypothetical protein
VEDPPTLVGPARYCRATLAAQLARLARCHGDDGWQVANRAVLRDDGALGPLRTRQVHMPLAGLHTDTIPAGGCAPTLYLPCTCLIHARIFPAYLVHPDIDQRPSACALVAASAT